MVSLKFCNPIQLDGCHPGQQGCYFKLSTGSTSDSNWSYNLSICVKKEKTVRNCIRLFCFFCTKFQIFDCFSWLSTLTWRSCAHSQLSRQAAPVEGESSATPPHFTLFTLAGCHPLWSKWHADIFYLRFTPVAATILSLSDGRVPLPPNNCVKSLQKPGLRR